MNSRLVSGLVAHLHSYHLYYTVHVRSQGSCGSLILIMYALVFL